MYGMQGACRTMFAHNLWQSVFSSRRFSAESIHVRMYICMYVCTYVCVCVFYVMVWCGVVLYCIVNMIYAYNLWEERGGKRERERDRETERERAGGASGRYRASASVCLHEGRSTSMPSSSSQTHETWTSQAPLLSLPVGAPNSAQKRNPEA